ncbi:fibronectin type III domain-containing protein [Demequina silvatica]|uniref:fibronectin type III domain-containing protein n=1 Tax=Demequina silvatica TaxID=1638988 RepID=UPI0007813420|nr:fibronectin type III domain-containing protein [Demequina silvatica]
MHFEWPAATGASAYRLEWSADPAFSSGTVTAIDTYALDYVTRYQPAVAAGTELYWRVAAFSTGVTAATLGDPSEAMLVETGIEASAPDSVGPGTVVGESPVAVVEYPDSTVFTWAPVVGAVAYQLEYTSDTLGGGAGITTEQVTGTQFAPKAPLARVDSEGNALTWKWRVRAVLYDGTTSAGTTYGDWSIERDFQISWNQAPTNLTPSASVDVAAYSDLVFSWDAVAGAAKYRVTFGTEKEGEGAALRILNPQTVDVYTTTYIPTSQAEDITRFWQVTPLDYAGNLGKPSAVQEHRKKWGAQNGPETTPTALAVAPEGVTGSLSSATAPSIPLSEFELEWEPLARATYYQVEVQDGIGGVYTCNTASTSATIIAFSSVGNDVLKGSGTCLWKSNTDKIHAGATYTYKVRAVDVAGSSTASYQSGAGSQVSGWSPARYVEVVAEPVAAPQSIVVDLDTLGFASGVAAEGGGQPAPLMDWNASGDPLEDGTWAYPAGYIVTLYKNPERTVVIGTVRTPSTRLRLNGVFADNTTANPYYAAIKPVVSTANLAATSVLTVGVDNESPEAFSWQKSSHGLTGLTATTNPVDGSVLLSWNPQSVTGLADGGSRGYQVRVYNGDVQQGTTKKVEFPFYVAQKPASSNDATFPSTMTDVPLAPGNNYSFDVAPLDANGNPGKATLSSTFTVGIATPAPEAAAISGGSAKLAWAPVLGALNYSVQYRVVGNSTWTTLTSIAQTSATINGLGQGNYEWQVRAHDASGLSANVSAWSTPVETFTVGNPSTAILMTDAITLSLGDRMLHWSSSVDGATRYQVQIAEDSAFTTGLKSYETVATSLALPDAMSSAKQYYWRVKALAEPVGSNAALKVLATSMTDPFTVLTAPAKVSLSSVTKAGTGLTATWAQLTGANAGTSDALAYVVSYRETSTDADWSAATEVETTPGATSLTIGPLTTGTAYQFRVAATNSEAIGPWSDVKEAATATAPTAAPTLTITPKVGELSLRIGSISSSNNGGSAITGYEVKYQRAGATEWETVPIGVTSTYALTSLGSATDYVVSVAAINAVGVGPATVVSSLTLGLSSAPTSVKAVRGDKSATASWAAPTAPNGTVTSYVVEKRIGTTGMWASAGTVSASTTKLTLTGLVNGKTYQVRVAAKTSVGVGAYSTPVKVVPAGKPFAPTTVKATSSTKGLLTVTWNKGVGNGSPITGYTVQFSTDGKRFTTIKKVGASTLKLTNTKGTRGKTVYFRVFSHNALGKSVASKTVSVVRK